MTDHVSTNRILFIKKLTFWFSFFIVCPVVVIFQNISFYIFLLLMVSLYRLSRSFFSLNRPHQWWAALFFIGAVLSIMYMPYEVENRGGLERSFQVIFNYAYWTYLVIFLIINRNYIDVNELANVVASEFGVKPNINYLEARKEVLHAHSEHSKIGRFFKVNPSISLAEGLHKMTAWAKKTGVRKSNDFSNIEVSRNLPEGWR